MEENLWLECYKRIIKSEPWYRSEKKINQLTTIMAISILTDRLNIFVTSHANVHHSNKL